MAKNVGPEGDIITVPVDAPAVEKFVENATKNSKIFTEEITYKTGVVVDLETLIIQE